MNVDSSSAKCGRTALLRGALVFGVLIVAITETLSMFGMISFAGIAAADAAAALVVAGLGLSRSNPSAVSPDLLKKEPWSRIDQALVGGIASILLLTLVVALAAAPNSVDTLGYHLARVVHWIQNGSVELYPSADLRQLGYPPFAEFVFLHLVALTGSDRLVNLVQWSASAISIVAVSLVARELGGGRRSQVLAAVFAATIPKGLLQATGAKNDWVLTLWIVAAIYFLLRLRRTALRADTVAAAAALGLAILTKFSASLFVGPFVVWLATASAKRISVRRAVPTAALGVALFVAVVGGHATRNFTLFGSPTGPPETVREYGPTSHPVVALISNSIRNAGLQLATPWQRTNEILEHVVRAIHESLGLDVDDPRTSIRAYSLKGSFRHEVLAGSPLHALLAGWAIAAVLLVGRWRARTDLVLFSGAVLAGFALFSMTLRWQSPNSRLLFPLFVIGAPVIGVLLGDAARADRSWVVAAALLIVAPIWILFSESRPLWGHRSVLLVPRMEQYFAMSPHLRDGYVQACARLRSGGHRQIGVVLRDGEMTYEYPIWKLLESAGEPVRIEHVMVPNESSRLFQNEPFASFRPSAVLFIATLGLGTPPAESITVEATSYLRSWQQQGVTIYERADSR